MGTEYPDAIDYYVDPSRVFVGQNSHSAIVVHGTGGNAAQTAQQLGDYFRTTSDETSSHFGIDRAGVICQYVHLGDGAAANCCLESGHDAFWDQFNGDNLNIHTISIEHVNDSANSLPLTPAQQEASFKLVAWLCSRYGLTFDQVKTHQSIAPSSRARCPGAAYPLDELNTFLQGAPMQQYSTNSADFSRYFALNGDGWSPKKPNGTILPCIVRGGNLALYETLSLDGNTLPLIGLPRTSELPQADIDGYAWTVQFFERGVMVFDSSHKKDSQPGMGSSYLGKYDQFKLLDPLYQAGQIVVQLPDTIKADIKALAPVVARLIADAGL
jgi:N-acetyl-anhydromuramyl-L-alanine amidase AmpD